MWQQDLCQGNEVEDLDLGDDPDCLSGPHHRKVLMERQEGLRPRSMAPAEAQTAAAPGASDLEPLGGAAATLPLARNTPAPACDTVLPGLQAGCGGLGSSPGLRAVCLWPGFPACAWRC